MVNPSLWTHFVTHFGQENILPIALAGDDVECDLPEGVRGKVPSVFNTFGVLVGFAKWQEGRAKASDINRWMNDARYGFGVRLGCPLPSGGVAVCIDVDTENQEYQATVERLLRELLPVLPMRVRENSTRRAYVLCVETSDQIQKRVLQLTKADKANGIKGEAVEILAYGQQFAAAGRHPSGADIEWLNGPNPWAFDPLLPDMTRDRVSLEQFTALVTAIGDALPVINDTEKKARKRAGKGASVPADAVATYLDENGWTLDIGKEGERHIRSPFESEYTTEQGIKDTSVTYFLPGTRDYEQGHFVSLHASDAARSDADFLNAIGYVSAQFESLPVADSTNGKGASRPQFTQVKGGKQHDRIEATLLNCLAALSAPQWLGHYVAYDAFAGDIVIGGPGNWRTFQDRDYIALRVELEKRGFIPVGRDLIKDAVHEHAATIVIDTAKQWLKAQKWDGVKRVETFLHDYMSTSNDEYTRAVSLYMWTALAGRCLVPGIKADMMPVLVGDQGCGKSTGVEALAPDLRWFIDMSFHDNDADQARKMRGVLVAEFAEMNGLRTRAIEAIKAMVTRTTDKFIEKYQTHKTEYARRCLFLGTSNDDELLSDSTGNRRWLPVRVGQVDVERIRDDRAQLWAEAAVLFKKHGIAYKAATMAANNAEVHEIFRDVDPVEDVIRTWLANPVDLGGATPSQKGYVTTTEIILSIGQNVGVRLDRSGQQRIGKALLALGFVKSRKRINNCFASIYRISPDLMSNTDLITGDM